MNIISTLERDIARLEAHATYHEGRAVHCRQEAALLKSEFRQEQSETAPTLEELRELAQIIRFTVGGFASNGRVTRTQNMHPVSSNFRRPNGIIRSVDVIDDNVLTAAKT
jgi:hypothetical protein